MAKAATKTNATTPNTTETKATKMAGFEDILNTPMAAVEKPKPRPVGTYVGIVSKAPEIKKIGKNETLAAIFEIKLLQPGADVDISQLQDAGGIGERTIRLTQFLTQDALWRLKSYLEALGIEDDGRPIGAYLPETVGRQALYKIKHRPSPDGASLFEEIDSVAAV